MVLLEKVWYGIQKIFEENNDPRTKNLLLVSSPYSIILIIISYLTFCLYCGPRFMKNRKPYELTNTLIVYNALQVMFSLYLSVGGFFTAWYKNYSYSCEPLDYSDNPLTREVTRMVWWYYFAKITELLDTVFFILRKKNNQVTFLHVYHHTIMPLAIYMGIRFFPNGHGTLFGVINSFVHVVMYSYYLIAGLGPQYQKYLWWKKHVTTIQLVQFVIVFMHNFFPLFTDCTYPKGLHFAMCCEATIFIYLFGKFYFRSYTQNSQKKSTLTATQMAKLIA